MTLGTCDSPIFYPGNSNTSLMKFCSDGTFERIALNGTRPASQDPTLPIQSKDTIYSNEINAYVRIHIPTETFNKSNTKLPVIVYIHGGAFVYGHPNILPFHDLTGNLSKWMNCIVTSVDYRLAPENVLPTAFNDSWTAFQWVASHVNGNGAEDWLNYYADFDKVFVMGDSVGATIALNVALRFGQDNLKGVNLRGTILSMPALFGSLENITGTTKQVYEYIYPSAIGTNNFLLNPIDDPNLHAIGSTRILLIIGDKDVFKPIQLDFYNKVGNSTWNGTTTLYEIPGAEHVFYLNNLDDPKAIDMLQEIADFVKTSNA